ncbi:MAG: glycosyltransferase [Vicinamibacterales bacterium]
MKVAVVVQRYGAEINGGAELHARYIAEHLARHVTVEVLTTCARDYITWANEFPAGESVAGGVTVRRFPVDAPRDPKTFGDWSERVFGLRHSVNDELAWLDAEGPASGELVRFVSRRSADYDFFLFFSLRYYHAYHGARAVPDKAILVPTAERDEALGLQIFVPVLRSVRALMYNSPEERALLCAVSGSTDVPGVVVGVGSEVPSSASAARFRQRTGLRDRIAIYIGRIDENKGCRELFDFWTRYADVTPGGPTLVLIGTPVLSVPAHPRIQHLGFVSDEEKYDALAAAEFLIMPSYFESLSMVALEAWAMGKPVLANGRCDVLRGQAVRSNAGLYYESYPEFAEAVRVLDGSAGVAATLGRNGSAFFKANYAWPVIERKYLDMFDRLSREDAASRAGRVMPALPGWWARRQKTLPPAREVLAQLPAGPVLPTRSARAGGSAPHGQARQSRRPDGRPGRDGRDKRPHRAVRPQPASGPAPVAPAKSTGEGAASRQAAAGQRGHRRRRGARHGRRPGGTRDE